jgi:hypothetical protein
VLEHLKSTLADYEQYRRHNLPQLEISGIYTLFPDVSSDGVQAEAGWPQPYHMPRKAAFI